MGFYTGGRKRLIAFLAVIAALLALAAAWRWTPLQDWLSPQRVAGFMTHFSSPAGRALVAVAGVGLASVLMVPLTFLAVVGGIIFPGWLAFVYVLVAALVGSALGVHRRAGDERSALERISGSRLGQLSRQLAKRGTIAVAVLRLVPIAPFAVFNLVAGASHLGFQQLMVGSLPGLVPGLGVITLFSGTLWAAVSEPTWEPGTSRKPRFWSRSTAGWPNVALDIAVTLTGRMIALAMALIYRNFRRP